MHFTFICLNILGLLEPWTNVTRRRMAKEALIAPIMITSESYHNYSKRGCKQTTLGVARHTLHCAARTPSSELRGLGVNKLYLTKFMDICQHSLWVVQLTNTHFSTLHCRHSIHFSAFNLQRIGEFRGKHLPRYRLFFMGCSLGPRMWPD